MAPPTRSSVEGLLARCVEQGQALVSRASLVGDVSDYESWKANRNNWVELTAKGLTQMYGGSAEAQRFRATVTAAGGDDWQAEYASDLACMRASIGVLESLQAQLGPADEPSTEPPDLSDAAHETPLEPMPGDQAPDLRDSARHASPESAHDSNAWEVPDAADPARAEPIPESEPPTHTARHVPGDSAAAAETSDVHEVAEPEPAESSQVEPETPQSSQAEPEIDDVLDDEAERAVRPAAGHEPATTTERSQETAGAQLRALEVELAPEPTGGSALVPESARAADLADEPAGGSALVHESAHGTQFAPPLTNGVASTAPSATPAEAHPENPEKRVFVVHGVNERWKQKVVRLLERSGPHEVTILHERPSEGRTLIEQSAGSGYAIIVLTADEVGAVRLEPGHEPCYSPRAPQSIVFEMGLLVGVLTPRYVCVLYERGVDLPSDVYGLAYVLLDMAGAWRSKLLMQLRSAGFDYDVDELASV